MQAHFGSGHGEEGRPAWRSRQQLGHEGPCDLF